MSLDRSLFILQYETQNMASYDLQLFYEVRIVNIMEISFYNGNLCTCCLWVKPSHENNDLTKTMLVSKEVRRTDSVTSDWQHNG